MILAKVSGRIISTIHHPDMTGYKLLVCDKLNDRGQPNGNYVIAVDNIGAGAGETVIILDEGTGARQVLQADGMPVRSVIVGVVDHVR